MRIEDEQRRQKRPSDLRMALLLRRIMILTKLLKGGNRCIPYRIDLRTFFNLESSVLNAPLLFL